MDDSGTDVVETKPKASRKAKTKVNMVTYICTVHYDILKPGDTITVDMNNLDKIDAAAINGGLYRLPEDYV